VPEENQRLRLYKKIAGAISEAAINEIRAEMEDRYGALPDPTVYLLEASQLRLECERMGIAQIDRKRGELQIRFTENAAVDPTQSDEAGGAQRQARRAVHAAGSAQAAA
jgi:transcription-repair coupling factor (superfamily II helicase)